MPNLSLTGLFTIAPAAGSMKNTRGATAAGGLAAGAAAAPAPGAPPPAAPCEGVFDPQATVSTVPTINAHNAKRVRTFMGRLSFSATEPTSGLFWIGGNLSRNVSRKDDPALRCLTAGEASSQGKSARACRNSYP